MTLDRRGFLKSLIDPIRNSVKSSAVRPPYSRDPELFEEHCPECEGNCITACPEKIIIRDKSKLPRLDFQVGACTFCQVCAENCPHPVLDIGNPSVILGKARIDLTKCLGWNEVICHTCAMICKDQAVELNNLLKPRIIPDRCTSCGLCVKGCPTDAIEVTSL